MDRPAPLGDDHPAPPGSPGRPTAAERAGWTVTTHEWERDVDVAHLDAMRTLAGEAGGGVRHLVLEILAYAQDEAASTGRRGRVLVTFGADGSVGVRDDGRGTDTRRTADGTVVRKPVMATADVRFTDESTAPLLPDGLPRRGMSCVAAVSAVLTHENHRADGSWAQTYRHGIPESDLVALPPDERTGTLVRFLADVPGPDRLTTGDRTAFADLTVVVRDETPDRTRDRTRRTPHEDPGPGRP